MAVETIYDSIPEPVPFAVPSENYQANRLAEFGTRIKLGGSNRLLTSFTVCFATWAYRTKYPDAPNPDWSCDITLNLYAVDPNDKTLPGDRLLLEHRNFAIPWREEPDPTCDPGGSTRWRDPDGLCHNSMAFTLTFDGLDKYNLQLPDEFIYGIAYNTQSGGYSPIGIETPSNDLNVAVVTVPPSLGSNPLLPDKFLNSSEPGVYADGGAAGVGVYRLNVGADIVDADGKYPVIAVAVSAVPVPPPPVVNPPGQELEDARTIWAAIEQWMGTKYTNATYNVAYDGTGTNHFVSCQDAENNRRNYQEYIAGVRINVNPTNTSLGPAETQQFQAIAGGTIPIPQPASPYVWTMEPGSLGTVDGQTGLYTAPATVPYATTASIRCTLVGTQSWTITQISLHP